SRRPAQNHGRAACPRSRRRGSPQGARRKPDARFRGGAIFRCGSKAPISKARRELRSEPAPFLLSVSYFFVVESSLVEDPDFDFELLLSLLLLGEVALLPEEDGDASDDAEPGAVDDGVDCAPDVLSGVACVPYGDLW